MDMNRFEIKTWCSTLVLTTLVWIPLAQAADNSATAGDPRPYLMAAMGDSIGAGTFANTSADADSDDYAKSDRVDGQGLPKNKFMLTNRYNLSWGTGDKISSNYELLKSWLQVNEPGATLSRLNLAVPGTKSRNINIQAKQLLNIMNSGSYRALKYLAIDIGSDDACGSDTSEGTDNTAFAEELKNFFATLSQIQQREPIRVIVSSIPNIAELGLPNVRHTKTIFGLSCQTVRKYVFKYCHTLPYWSSDEQFTHNVQVVVHKNKILSDLVDEVNRDYPNIQAHFSSAIFKTDVNPAFLSMDCFHPNALGQTQFSKDAWADQPWFK